MTLPLRLYRLGLQDFEPVWHAMSRFTNSRQDQDLDQLWVVQHTPVLTQGQAGKPEHLLADTSIPLVQTDRGGQITYHGPGQLIVYPLVNLRRRKLSVRNMVSLLEQTAIDLMAAYDVIAYSKTDAPGVYLRHNNREAKIASLGLRVRRGCSFHGMSINVAMDLTPFRLINPCGYPGLEMTQMYDLPEIKSLDYFQVEQSVIDIIASKLDAKIIEDNQSLPLLSRNP